jgi:hypothetical protein
MGLSAKQLTALRRPLDSQVVRTREANGRELSYLEGWYVISEANRIFGFDGWSRETLDTKCVLARENRGTFLAVYIARVRITVHSGGTSVIREGHGSGERRGDSPGEVHDIALKAAETDATKRALSTFGKPFGLELYRSDKAAPTASAGALVGTIPAVPSPALQSPALQSPALQSPAIAPTRLGLHPDDTTPIPRPSRYYGRRQSPAVHEHFSGERRQLTQTPAAPPIAPAAPDLPPGRIDKSALTIGEPKRLRDKHHLKFVASQPCLICGRQPADPHHLRFAQPRAIGMKVSDEFTVPLCRGHHRQLHQVGNEQAWWDGFKISPLPIARDLWEQTHPQTVTAKPSVVTSTSLNGQTPQS